MTSRKGEKIGWTAGWLGGFLWVAALSAIFLFQGKWMAGLTGITLLCAASVSIIFFAPWRYPSLPYWKLLIIPYGLFFASVAWAVWAYGGIEATGMDEWALLWLVPLLIPFGTLSRRRWSDSDTR